MTERDFTNCPKEYRNPTSAQMGGKCLVIDNEDYMVKFPPPPTKKLPTTPAPSQDGAGVMEAPLKAAAYFFVAETLRRSM